ncbi:hypothetical protein D9M69_638850 [compost metagenome]
MARAQVFCALSTKRQPMWAEQRSAWVTVASSLSSRQFAISGLTWARAAIGAASTQALRMSADRKGCGSRIACLGRWCPLCMELETGAGSRAVVAIVMTFSSVL